AVPANAREGRSRMVAIKRTVININNTAVIVQSRPIIRAVSGKAAAVDIGNAAFHVNSVVGAGTQAAVIDRGYLVGIIAARFRRNAIVEAKGTRGNGQISVEVIDNF